MTEQVDEKCNVKDILFSENAPNVELPDLARHDKIKLYKMSDILVNMKAEVSTPKVQYNMINSPDDIKVEFDNGLQYCEHCTAYYEGYCVECGMLVHILNKIVLNNMDNGKQKDLPNDNLEIRHSSGEIGIFALKVIPEDVKFGPFTGLTRAEWKIKGGKFVLHSDKSIYLNWMQYINHAKNVSEQNLYVFQNEDNLYYQSTRQIQAGEELLVYFGVEYDDSLNKNLEVDFYPTTEHINNVFGCTFCCFGFSSQFYLTKHKMKCIEGPATGRCSIEELTQCSFCNIQLDPKEYLEHHMVYCRERNVRKCSLPTPTNQIAAVNQRLQMFKCEQCIFTAKYKADLESHINDQHGSMKIYQCVICKELFKTKKSLRTHVENTHTSIGEKEELVDSKSDFVNDHLKGVQSKSPDQKKKFKCPDCEFQTKYKQSLKSHIKAKHLREFDYTCDKCEFRTHFKHNLDIHIKTIHLKQFNHICDSCGYITNKKYHLKRHVKRTHLKQFDYNCDLCEYKTNGKENVEAHVKSKHLKIFDYKCDSCEYRTNYKRAFEIHVKEKHLKEFRFKCDSCEYRTNYKYPFEIHVKEKHLKEFKFKCDSCEYRTNSKHTFEIHGKEKHLEKIGDRYDHDPSEFITNLKNNFERHIKTGHLKEFESQT